MPACRRPPGAAASTWNPRIALRDHYPILRRRRFFTGVYNPDVDVKDVTWINPRGQEKTQESWGDPRERCFGMVLDGRAQESGIKKSGSDQTLLIVTNAHHDVVNFKLPESPEGRRWQRLLDTNDPKLGNEHYAFGAIYQVTGRSLLVFLLELDGNANGAPAPRARRKVARK